MQRLLMVLLIFNTTNSLAQSLLSNANKNSHFKGVVVDSVHQITLGYVTVVAKESGKTDILGSTLSRDDGSFYLNFQKTQTCQITFSFIGYKTKIIHLPEVTSSLDLGTINLVPETTQLDEVQVIILRPLIEHDLGRTIYNVENDPENQVLNTLDMFRKVPFLTLDPDDNLQLNGSNNYQILVNGKRSALFAGNPSDVLRSLPASAVKRIEVITNPSARYEASGVGGIVNIVTQEKSVTGLNGSLNLAGSTPKAYSGNTFLSATAGKMSISGRYSNTYSTRPSNRSFFFRENLLTQNRVEQLGSGNSNSRGQSMNGEVSYELSPHDQLTASYSLIRSIGANKHLQQTKQLSAAEEVTEAFENFNNTRNKNNGHDISLDYQHSFTRNDQQVLNFSFNAINSRAISTSDFNLQPLVNYERRFSTTGNRDLAKEYSLLADYAQPLGKHLLEFGVKSIFEENSSDYYYKNLDLETSVFVQDSSQSNNFHYRQDIHAAYLSLHLKLKKWGLRSGGRLEETRLNADFSSSRTRATQKYRNLLPTVTLSYTLKGNSRINLTYNQRISRPGLYYLNPYVDAIDPLNIYFGNPGLVPVKSHALQVEYNVYFKTTSLNVLAQHSFSNNSIQQFTFLGSDSVAHTTYGNIGANRNFNFSLSGNITLLKKLSLNLNAAPTYVIYTSMLDSKSQRNEGFTYSVRGALNYRLGKTWRVSGNLNYNSPNILLQGSTNGYTWSSVSLNKQFLKNEKASLNLSVRSPFEARRRSISEITGATFYQKRESLAVIRQFTVGFNYRFTKLNTSAPPEN